MLAKPTKAITEVLDRFEGKEFTCEYKYDGERAQVHMMEGGEIAVFSRNSENMSAKYPDLVEQIPRVSNALLACGEVLMAVHQRRSEKLRHRC
jgi:DNA ligase-1